MAEKYTLEAQSRTILGKKVSQLRRQGLVPVVVYGPKIQSMNLQIPYRPLQLTLAKAGGTQLIDIQVDGSTTTVLAREVQRDVLRDDILHVNFFAVDLKSVIRADIPVHFVGESPAVASKQGILITGPTVLTIEALPANLPGQIEIDLSRLAAVGDGIHVRDLDLDADILVINDPNEMIVHVTQPSAVRAEEEEEAAAAAAEEVPAEPEVISKGKAEEEEEA